MRWLIDVDLIEIALALAICAIAVPGLLWWIGTAIGMFAGERPW